MAKDGIKVHIYGDYDNKDIDKAIRDLKSLKTDAGQAEKQMGVMSKGMKAAGVAIAAAAAGMGYAVGRFAVDAISAASDLGESQSKVTAVFKDQADEVMAWAETSATAFGQSKQQALEAAGTYGNLFQAFGLTSEAAQQMSIRMVELAADLASFNNTSIDDAIQALRSGLSGETEPLKRFGIAINDARLKSEALALGIYDGVGALNAGQKAQASYQLILQDTTLAQGDFARTSDGLANTQRILQAAVENAKAEIGTGLVNAIVDVIGVLGGTDGMVARIEDASEKVGTFTVGIGVVIRNLVTLNRSFATTTSGLLDFASANRIALRIVTAGVSELAFRAAEALYEIGEAEQDAQATTEAWADYRRAQQGVVNITPAVVDSLNDTAAAAAGTARSGAAAAKALLQYAISTGQVPDKAWMAQRFDVAEMLDNIGKTAGSAGSKVSGSSKSMGESLKELRKEFRGTFGEETKAIIDSISESLTSNLDAAQEKVTSWAQGMTSTIMQGFGLSSTYESALQEDGKVSAAAWIKAVDDQVAQWEWFGNVLNAVRGPGNDPARQALAEYLASEGVDKGGTMGQALIDEGLIDTMAGKMQAVRDQAALVAQNMVPEYLIAGVDSAQATYNGWKAAIGKDGPVRKALNNLMDNLAASMKRDVRIDIVTVRTEINEVINRVSPSAAVTPRANGGPLFTGMPTLVGERGPELIIPRVSGTVVRGEKTRQMMRQGGGDVYLTVNAGMGTNGAEVGRQIVDALKAYERRNGPVYASA